MSGVALIWAANVKGLKPHTKIVLIQLADFHNKETGRCFPSAKRLADECEMDRTTVFRHLNILIEKGLVSRHSRGDGKGGRASNEYELHLDIVLGPSANHKETSQKATTPPVAERHYPSGGRATTLVAESDTNLNNKPGIEPERESCDSLGKTDAEAAVDDYNAVARSVGWSECKKLTKQRRSKVLARLADVGGLPGWRDALARASRSPYLLGKVNDFRLGIDFLLRESSFAKLNEGFYDPRQNASRKESPVEFAQRAAERYAARRMDSGPGENNVEPLFHAGDFARIGGRRD